MIIFSKAALNFHLVVERCIASGILIFREFNPPIKGTFHHHYVITLIILELDLISTSDVVTQAKSIILL